MTTTIFFYHLTVKANTKLILSTCIVILCTFFYNEYLIYYLKFASCDWPRPELKPKLLNLMLIADTHLLGSRNGHWFDKLRREWQMYRAFQTARFYLQPDYIVIMGDLTDEGKWCSDWEWAYYENRVQELFYTDKNTELIVIVGNHDVGFHYDIINHKIQRFNRTYKSQFASIQFAKRLTDVNFIVLNSMTLENDNCNFCKRTQKQLKEINTTLECLRSGVGKKCSKKLDLIKDRLYSRPILFTHFPLYRDSDRVCPKSIDSEVEHENFREKYDCLSREATKQIINQMNPRLVFNGHTHFSCYNELHGVPEYTLASFSWRNIQTPSMLVFQVDGEKHFVDKCFLPSEIDVFYIYGFCLVYAALVGFYTFCRIFRQYFTRSKPDGFKVNLD